MFFMSSNRCPECKLGHFDLCSAGNWGGTQLGKYGGIDNPALMYRKAPCPAPLQQRMGCPVTGGGGGPPPPSPPSPPPPPPPPPASLCRDKNPRCPGYTRYCPVAKYKQYMSLNCKKSCKLCEQPSPPATQTPTVLMTSVPTEVPTVPHPPPATPDPTEVPTYAPTGIPEPDEPEIPGAIETAVPVTEAPTEVPSMTPTEVPTKPHPPPATPDPTERPTRVPTRTPTRYPSRAPVKPLPPPPGGAKLVMNSRGCASQLRMLCKTCSAKTCVAMAATQCTPRGGDGTVMWSPRYNRWWGCRCCRPKGSNRLHVNGNWQLWGPSGFTFPPMPPTVAPTRYKGSARRIQRSKGCARQLRMVCKHCSAQECVGKCAAYKGRGGDGTCMWSPRYNRWWGCRCCRPPYGRALHSNRNWELWGG